MKKVVITITAEVDDEIENCDIETAMYDAFGLGGTVESVEVQDKSTCPVLG